jgi:hypothetical protein
MVKKAFFRIKSKYFNPNPSGYGTKRAFLICSPGCLKQNIFVNQKCFAKYLKNFFCFGVLQKNCHFQCAFDDNVSPIHVLLANLQGSRKSTPSPLPLTVLCSGWRSTCSFSRKSRLSLWF